MRKIQVFLILVLGLQMVSCSGQEELEVNKVKPQIAKDSNEVAVSKVEVKTWINPEGMKVKDRILLPDGYTRKEIVVGSFHEYLMNHPLKEDGAYVEYYNGDQKITNDVYCAVFDQEIGTKDLHQCADAVMNLRATYFFEKKEYDKIHFNFTSGDRADFKKYAEGYRAVIKGSKVSWVKSAQSNYSEKTFRKYMELI